MTIRIDGEAGMHHFKQSATEPAGYCECGGGQSHPVHYQQNCSICALIQEQSSTETPTERHYRLLGELNAELLAEAMAVLEALQDYHIGEGHQDRCGANPLCARIEPLRAVISKAGG